MRVVLNLIKVHVKEILKTKATEHLVAYDGQLLFKGSPSLFVLNDFFENQRIVHVF